MSKRRVVWMVVCILAIISSIGIIYSTNAFQDITLGEVGVQEKIDARLPLVKNDFTVKHIKVNFTNSSLVIVVDGEGKKWGQEFIVSLEAQGIPYYDSFKGKFYFRPQTVKVTSLKTKSEPVSAKVEKFIDRFVSSPKITTNKVVLGADAEAWVHSSMENTTIWALKRLPIYTLPNTLKGNAFRMLLKSVEIGDDKITLHLSFWQFTKMVVMYVIILLFAIVGAIAIVMNPGWGIPLFLIGGLVDS
ncbi:MAG: hypothetical protein Q8R55_05255 [Candidatus Taylorbacteria bacterium]|nr:hypothetical protein [Candidatus Taylorbacteria bacterium]